MGDTKNMTDEVAIENKEWLDSLDYVYREEGSERVRELLRILQTGAQKYGILFQCPGNTPYINSIPVNQQPPYPGDRKLERRIKSIIRWNAMAMVVRANRKQNGIGGHISTYASQATLFEVGFNHFFKGKRTNHHGDIVYFQGHASPGIYARAFLEGRLKVKDLENFRRELNPKGGLSSYPHPWLMSNFWEFPSVSMGLSPIMAIYQARFNRYLEDRGILEPSDRKVWAFLGDGEMDEPESMGAITLPAREGLDNLIFVINCNLQRLDGPVRGNGKMIQELEAAFKGAGWHVIKVIWGSDWDPLFDMDKEGVLVRELENLPDGQMQKYAASSGDFIRKDFFEKDPRLAKMVEDYSDEKLQKMRRGGHDPVKVYSAYKAAVEHSGSPTVILAHTIKGYGLGEAGEGRNVTHQQKKLNEEELMHFRSRFDIPVSDRDVSNAPFYIPPDESEEIKYIKRRRDALGGYIPERKVKNRPIEMPSGKLFEEFLQGSGDREVATTMVMVRLISKLLDDKRIGDLIVPIIPDEARTFGMESLFRKVGIYSRKGQNYEPVDRESLLYYKEATNGVILEEGITEAGSISSFMAAGTAYATHGINTIPFFLFYSMFGFQRIGDLIWAAGDARAKGFLVGGTSGRTTLAGEGLQHQDGQSHVLALSVPNLRAYDPTFAYEIAVIIKNGLSRMYVEGENIFFYITVMNEFYKMPSMPEKSEEGIIKGLYKLKASENVKSDNKVNLLGSGAILLQAMEAAHILEDKYGIATDVWSATSFKELYRDAVATERYNRLQPDEKLKIPYITQCFSGKDGVFVAVSDYLKALPLSLGSWIPGKYIVLGTDGFGRSDSRSALRDFFEVDSRHIVLAALSGLSSEKKITKEQVKKAINDLDIDPGKLDPAIS